jgi:hypothetical protein
VPQVLLRGQPAVGLLAQRRAQVPAAGRGEAGAGQPVGAGHHDAVGGRLGGQRAGAGVPLGVRVPPGAQGVEGEPERAAGQQPVHHAEAALAVGHGQFALHDHIADPPAPPGQAVDQLETFQVPVAVRGDRAAAPLVAAEPHLHTGR